MSVALKTSNKCNPIINGDTDIPVTILVVSRGSRANASSSLVMSVVSDIVGCIVVELGAVILLGASSGMSVTSVVSNTTTQHDNTAVLIKFVRRNALMITEDADKRRQVREVTVYLQLLSTQYSKH